MTLAEWAIETGRRFTTFDSGTVEVITGEADNRLEVLSDFRITAIYPSNGYFLGETWISGRFIYTLYPL